MALCKDIWFGSFGPSDVVFNKNSGDHKDVMMEQSTLIFPSAFIRRELDIIFGSYNGHEKGAIQVPSDTNSVSKDSTLIVPGELIVSGELNIKFGTFGTDKSEIKELKDDEKASFEVVEDIDKKLEIQNYLMKVLKLDQEVKLENPSKFLCSYEEELMETRRLGVCRDRLALHYLCSNKAGRFVGVWISDEEYLKAVETRKKRSSFEKRILADQIEKKVADENAIDLNEIEENGIDLKLKEQCLVEETVKENEAIEENKRNADVARVQDEARDQNVAEQKETDVIILEQQTKNDVTNEITSIPTVSSVETQMHVVLCVEEVDTVDQCNNMVAENNKQIMKNEEFVEPIVTSEIIDDTKEEKVLEITKEEFVSIMKLQHLLEETKKINMEIDSNERVDEEAQMQGELQTQKEAKKKEKARLKRLRNKEKKRAAISNISYQDVVDSNGSKELHNTNEEKSQRRPSHFSLMLSNFRTIESPSTVTLAVKKILLSLTVALTLFTIRLLH